MNDLEIVKSAVKNEGGDWYSVKEICDICNTSRQTWVNFKNDFNCKVNFTVKRNLKEGDKNVDYYPENILKTFQAWLLRNQANQGRASDTIKSIVKSAVKNEADWLSKKELADMCRVDEKTIQRTVNDILSLDTGVQTQSHIKNGGYHNSEVFYDDYLVKLIQAKLLSNQSNQGKTSDTIKSIVKSAVKNEGGDWMSKKELMDICKCSKKSFERVIANLNCDTGVAIQSHIKKGGYRNLEVFYDGYLVKLIQAKLLSNQANQGKTSDTIKSVVKTAVKNELTKTLSKDEIKLELARNKTLQIQYQAQKQIITEQEKTKREQIRTKRKETELELLRQKNISKKLKIKNFTEPLKQEIKTMTNELAQQAVQAEYTKKLKQLDADGKYMLYIFYNPTNPTIYKIGKSNSLGNRLAIGTSENPNLTILYKRWCNCQMACDELEETIHQELREYNYNNYSDTGSKEWFVLTKEKLNEIVNKYNFIQSSY